MNPGSRGSQIGPAGPPLEPIVALGARMSWAGLLRPGDAFCAARRSRRCTLSAETGPPLRRYYGTWSERYRRFGLTLGSNRVVVRSIEPDGEPGDGLQGILHWVHRRDVVRTDAGSACRGDGWPVELWERFTARLDGLPPGSVGEKLRAYADSSLDADVAVVKEWRSLVRGTPREGGLKTSSLGEGWVPVPARLEAPDGPTCCILSWSPSPLAFPSLHDALDSAEARRRGVDLANQAAYHVECLLAEFHGVAFGSLDAVGDARFEADPRAQRIIDSSRTQERQRVADPSMGRLDRFG